VARTKGLGWRLRRVFCGFGAVMGVFLVTWELHQSVMAGLVPAIPRLGVAKRKGDFGPDKAPGMGTEKRGEVFSIEGSIHCAIFSRESVLGVGGLSILRRRVALSRSSS